MDQDFHIWLRSVPRGSEEEEAERGVSLSLMDMVDISKSRTFLAQFGLVGKENALRQNYRKCSVVAAEIRIAKANVAILLRQR